MSRKMKVASEGKLNQHKRRNFKIAEEINNVYSGSFENKDENGDNENSQISLDFKQKVLTKMQQSLTFKKEVGHNIENKLTKLINSVKDVHLVYKQNLKEIKIKVANSIDILKKATTSIKQRINTLQEMHKNFKKQCNAKDAEHQDQIAQIEKRLYEEIIKIKKEILSQTKRNIYKMMLTILKAIQENS